MKNQLREKPRSFISQFLKNLNPKQHPLQKTNSDDRYELMSLGTEYGGWTFVNSPTLEGSTIISAGLGEDASFDVEFASAFNAKVIVVDPTPRAILHFNRMHERVGKANTTEYLDGGDQPVEAYDLSNINADQLVIDKRALWNEDAKIKFFQPTNPDNVSYSIVNFQNNYKDDGPFIEVDACPIATLLADYNIDNRPLELLKLDIEGAEIEVIDSMIGDGIYPNQICVEFDELQMNSEKAYSRVDMINELLEENGYKCVHTDGRKDFLFVRTSSF